GACAHEVLHQNLARRLLIAELELRVDFGDWLIPAQLLLIHKTREQKRGHALGIGGGHEEGVGIHRSRLAEFAHSKAALENHATAVHQRERGAGYAQLLHRGLDEAFDVGNAVRIERHRLAASEHLALVAFGPQALYNRPELRAALFKRGLRALKK